MSPNSITSADVGDGALRREDFAAGQIPAGPQGPAGQQGVQGPRGERGPSEAFGAFFDDVSMPPAGGFVDLASLDLAPGQYIVTGSFVVKNFQEHPRDVACTLGLPSPGGLVDLARVRVDTGGDQDAVVMLGGIDLDTAATVTIHCTPSGTIGTTGTLDFEDIDIGAIRVGALHTT